MLTISHLAWAPTWRKPNLHKLMTSAENQVDLLPFYPTSPVEERQVDPNTNLSNLIDSYVELFMCRT